MNLKRILRDASSSSLILLRNPVAKTSSEDSAAKDVFGSAKLENVFINDKALTDVSSIYKNLVFAGKPASDHEESSTKNNLYALKRYSTNTIKRAFLENQLENEKAVQATKENHKGRSVDKMKIIRRESTDEVLMMKKSANNNETSQIARILSEYNNSKLRKSAIHGRIYDSRSMNNANMTYSSANIAPAKNFWQKDVIIAEENPNFMIPDVNSDLDITQEKRRKSNPTLGEKIKENEIVSSCQSARNSCSMSSEDNQVPLADRQMSLNTLNRYMREKSVARSSKESRIVATEAKLQQEGTSFEDEIDTSTTEPLQELLENTAILYCAATGVHQDDLSNYIDTLDSKQSIQWLESWNNSVV